MDRKYITAPRTMQTGFLRDETEYRLKQGLAPQNGGGICYQPPSKNMYDLKADQVKIGPMYPTPVTHINYGPGSIPNNCACAKYLHVA